LASNDHEKCSVSHCNQRASRNNVYGWCIMHAEINRRVRLSGGGGGGVDAQERERQHEIDAFNAFMQLHEYERWKKVFDLVRKDDDDGEL
jgi:hypothetical protein